MAEPRIPCAAAAQLIRVAAGPWAAAPATAGFLSLLDSCHGNCPGITPSELETSIRICQEKDLVFALLN